jgi:hypothetical protein
VCAPQRAEDRSHLFTGYLLKPATPIGAPLFQFWFANWMLNGDYCCVGLNADI